MSKLQTRLLQHIRTIFAILLVLVLLLSTAGAQAQATTEPTVRVETYNVLSSDFTRLGNKIGGSVNQRMNRVTDVIKTSDDGKRAHVVGMQEVAPKQFRMLHDKLPGYSSFPAGPTNTRPIFWHGPTFKLMDSGYISYPWYNSVGVRDGTTAPWVRLKHRATGKQLYILNHHAVAYNNVRGSDKGGALKRERTAEIVLKWANKKAKDGRRVIITGDFNSSFILRNKQNYDKVKDEALNKNRNRLPYCIMTSTGRLTNTYDGALGRSGQCPSKYRDVMYVDHIYVSKKLKTQSWVQLVDDRTSRASDHFPTYSDIILK